MENELRKQLKHKESNPDEFDDIPELDDELY